MDRSLLAGSLTRKQERKRGKRKALSILESKLGRTVYEIVSC